MEILTNIQKSNVLTVKDLKQGTPFRVVNNEEDIYCTVAFNSDGYNVVCLTNGNLYKDFNTDVVKVNGTFVEDYDKIIDDKNYRIDHIAAENHKLKKQIEQLQAELDAVKKSEQEYKDTLIPTLNMESNTQVEELHKLKEELNDVTEELRETKNILAYVRDIQRQTAGTNDKLREYLSEKDKIIDSLRTEKKKIYIIYLMNMTGYS